MTGPYLLSRRSCADRQKQGQMKRRREIARAVLVSTAVTEQSLMWTCTRVIHQRQTRFKGSGAGIVVTSQARWSIVTCSTGTVAARKSGLCGFEFSTSVSGGRSDSDRRSMRGPRAMSFMTTGAFVSAVSVISSRSSAPDAGGDASSSAVLCCGGGLRGWGYGVMRRAALGRMI